MMTIQDLITHMTRYKNLFVVGPFDSHYQILTPEESESFTLRQAVRSPESFYQLYNAKIKTSYPKEENPIHQALSTLQEKNFVNKLYSQTYNHHYGDLGAIYLKGADDLYRCSSCEKTYKELPSDYKCQCGRKVRPNLLLAQEKYDLPLINQFEEDLKEYNTLFFIGFNLNEEELVKQLYIEANKKMNRQGKVVTVYVGECDKTALFDEFHFDFIVDELPETALVRFIELMENQK